MTGHRSFDTLRAGMKPERRSGNAAATQAMLQEMALHELRQARAKSQEDLAAVLQVGQPAVAKMERRTDMYVSNLKKNNKTLNSRLEIKARFPDVEVTIANF
nr:XRE family transcriptional regulator [Rhizobiaceae bacterium]